METVSANSGSGGGGGVTVVRSDAPSDYHIAPRSDNTNSNSTPGSALPQDPPQAPPLTVATATVTATCTVPMKKKRGRPRKYGPDGSVTMALSPKPLSSAGPVLSPPVIDFSSI